MKRYIKATTYIEDEIKEIRGMHINYKGKDPSYKYRVAEIDWDAETSDGRGAREVLNLLEDEGWDIQQFDGYCLVEVDSIDDYNVFKEDYKKAKKEAIERLKHQHDAE